MLTIDRLRAILSYSRRTGVFRWRVTRSNRVAGSVAGTLRSDGYIQIGIDGERFLAHRLAVFYVTGEWPPEETDHQHGHRSDNRFRKLRLASSSQNKFNGASSRPNTSGYRGVVWQPSRKRWFAFITFGGKMKNLGRYKLRKDAVEARRVAVAKHHGEFAFERNRRVA